MKLFIDTSNRKIILALIDNNNYIVDFILKKTNNDIVKNLIVEINNFLLKNNYELLEISDFLITIGPGSFTGVKIPLNIIRSVNLVKKIKSISTINTFDLLKENDKKFTAIKFGKTKFYLKNNKKRKVKIVTQDDIDLLENITIDYETFKKENLQEKIDDKWFKILDNLDKVKIKYITNFKR